jgi:hypothetical protein
MYSTTANFIIYGLIIVFGLFGNLVVLIVFSNKAFKKFPSRNIYRILAVFDSFAIIYAITNLFIMNFGIIYQNYDLIWFMSSEITYKIYIYFVNIFQSSYLLVFISIEKFISIRYPNNKIIKKQIFQTLIVVIIIICNLATYNFIFYLNIYKNQTTNTSNVSIKPINEETVKIIGIIAIVYNTGLPFIIMLIFSILLIHTILKSRLRILRLTNQRDRNRLRKDIQFAISSIFMNIFFLIFYLPYSISLILKFEIYSDLYVNVFIPIVALNYCDHFYISFFTNSVFRRRVLTLFRIRSRSYQTSNYT